MNVVANRVLILSYYITVSGTGPGGAGELVDQGSSVVVAHLL